MTDGIWLRTDEEREAVAGLQLVQRQLPAVQKDLYAWKQVALTLHAAVQAFMVLALRGTVPRHVLNKKSETEWLKWADNPEGEPPSHLRLHRFLNLYKKVKSQRMSQWDNSKCFSPGPTHDRSMRLLNSIRNEFTHFVPMGWSLEVNGMPTILLDSVSLLRFLAFESGNVR